jgi:toxin ParE1/3/4
VAQLRIRPRATEDLLEIWSYIADDSEANADGFIDKIYETMDLLARQPGMGRHREELALGIQSFPVGRYLIFYRIVHGALEIVRVLHGARDIENIFEG